MIGCPLPVVMKGSADPDHRLLVLNLIGALRVSRSPPILTPLTVLYLLES